MIGGLPRGKRLAAEFFGTFWLVFGGCGSAVLAAGVEGVGIGWLGVSLAFGLTVLTMAYAVGHISGGHFNPAVSLGLWAGKRFDGKDLAPYIVVQVIAAIVAAGVLFVIARGVDGFSAVESGFAANGFAEYSLRRRRVLARGYGIVAAVVAEFALTLIHLISIPVTNTSVNPARSIGPALFVGGWAIEQVWLFILVPIAGGVVGGLAYRYLLAPGTADEA